MNTRFINRRPHGAAVSPNGQAPRSVASRLWGKSTRSGFLPNALVALLIMIMVLPQGLDYSGSDFMPADGDLTSRIVWLVLLGGGIYLAARHSARTSALLRALNPFMLMFVGLATLSIAWSIEPAITLRRLIRLYTILLVCIGFAVVAWHPWRFQRSLRTLLTALCLASAIFCITSPNLAIHHVANHPELMNAWHGITTGKNLLGSLASCAVVLWLHGWVTKQVKPFAGMAGLGLSALCLIMTRSSTSLMATLFAVFFLLILMNPPGSLKRYMPYLVGIFAACTLFYAIAVLRLIPGLDFILTPITMFSGKDLTFTGRTDIWYVLNMHIKLSPLLGSGYGAYWIGPIPSSPSYQMLTLLYFYPTEGHNGYLDVVNDLGFVGAACLIGYFVSYIRQSLDVMTMDRHQGSLYLALIFRGFMADMSESHWFSVLSVDFVIFTLATVALARDLLQRKQARAERLNANAPVAPTPPRPSRPRFARP